MSSTAPTIYDDAFFGSQVRGSATSAVTFVPLVLRLLSALPVRSVVDFGCGTGVWLSEFQRAGVEDVLGIDGDYVSPATLRIPVERFRPSDLTTPLVLPRRYDLAICMEVAEHLPASASHTLINSIVRAADAVVFSACPPTPKHGTGHINEQPQSYWAELFEKSGYVASRVLRDQLWTVPQVEWFYRQNAVLYLRPSIADRCGIRSDARGILDVYHPEFVRAVIAESVRMHTSCELAKLLARRAREKLSRFFKISGTST